MTDIVDARADLGAVGDGTTDNWKAIAEWLAVAPEGSRLLIPGGRYRISKGLTIERSVQLVATSGSPGGPNPQKCVLVTDDKSNAVVKIAVRSKRQVVVVDGVSTSGGRYGIEIDGDYALSYASRLQSIHIRRPKEAGLVIRSGWHSAAIRDLSVSGGHIGIQASTEHVGGSTWDRIRVSSAGDAGIEIGYPTSSGQEITITGATIESSGGPAIRVRGGAQVNLFGGHLENNGTAGPKTDAAADIEITADAKENTVVSLFGTNLGSPSKSQKSTKDSHGWNTTRRFKLRYKTDGNKKGNVRLNLHSVRFTSAIVDGLRGTHVREIAYYRQLTPIPRTLGPRIDSWP